MKFRVSIGLSPDMTPTQSANLESFLSSHHIVSEEIKNATIVVVTTDPSPFGYMCEAFRWINISRID